MSLFFFPFFQSLGAPTFQTLSTTNPLATVDRLVGTLLIHPVKTTNVLLRAEVNSDPCPDVQWQLNGTNITSSDGAFSFDNPCLDTSAISPYNFSLTILVLTKIYSGNYSAIFNNRYSTSSTLPEFFVTVPGMYVGASLPSISHSNFCVSG